MNDKLRSYIWLFLAVLSAVCAIIRMIDVFNGMAEWSTLVAMAVVVAFCTKNYFCYKRKQMLF